MKKIINGKRYNTETAEEIADWGNGYGRSDFKFCKETLYRTKKGAFFLYGDGGAMSRYSQPCGNMTGGGKDIIPMDDDEVAKWLENTGNYNALEVLFPEKLEDA